MSSRGALFLGSSSHILVGLQCVQPIKVARTIKRTRTYVWVEEERIHSPGEGFSTNVEVIVVGREGDVTIVLGLQVFLVLSVFSLDLLYPEVAGRDCFVRVNLISTLTKVKSGLLAGRQP